MWTYNNIVSIELGKGVLYAVSSPDRRTMIERIYRNTPEDDAKILLDEIKSIRKKNVYVPTIRITDNYSLQYNEFVCYWGVECHRQLINSTDELYKYLYNKSIEYTQYLPNRWNKELVKQSLKTNLQNIKRDEIQTAYDNYKGLYYVSNINDYRYECIQILTELSNILTKNGQLDDALLFSSQASKLCEDKNIVDPIIKCQVYLNLGYLQIAKNDLQNAFSSFEKCSDFAYYCQHTAFQLFAMMGMAECFALNQEIRKAITMYENMLTLINCEDKVMQPMALNIYREIHYLYRQLLSATEKEIRENKMKQWCGNVLCNVASYILRSLVNVAICKICNINGYTTLLSFGTNYSVGEIINSQIQLGNNNIQNN